MHAPTYTNMANTDSRTQAPTIQEGWNMPCRQILLVLRGSQGSLATLLQTYRTQSDYLSELTKDDTGEDINDKVCLCPMHDASTLLDVRHYEGVHIEDSMHARL